MFILPLFICYLNITQKHCCGATHRIIGPNPSQRDIAVVVQDTDEGYYLQASYIGYVITNSASMYYGSLWSNHRQKNILRLFLREKQVKNVTFQLGSDKARSDQACFLMGFP
jgi:hypothetical protein